MQFGGIADERNFLPMTQKANLAFKENVEDKLREIILWHDALMGLPVGRNTQVVLHTIRRGCFNKQSSRLEWNNDTFIIHGHD